MKPIYFIVCFAIFLIGCFFTLEAKYMGFPSSSGGATELERAQRPLFYQYGSFCFFIAAALLTLSYKADGSRWRNLLRILILLLFFVLSLIVYEIDQKFVSTLNRGEGG
ncbi:hypothetical protein [Leptospira stimsonii]|uniref:Lipoprotein n=1 Tax=Leptospira stimsonii TaxID=2202203 RepID=A0A396Z205_9LEPT|nr:hypothetical protein [Leptospira stimsonii]RHX87200.1 hypothetical protein DLM75_16970 [Leptospira stimsonii]